jgi:SAM-dependent methyltransferase
MAAIGGLDLSYRVSQCAVCGFGYASHLPDAATYLTYYREFSKYDVLTSAFEVGAADRIRASAAVALCRPYLEDGATVADVGCGVGILLNAFAAAGCSNLFGIDPAPHASEKARSIFGLSGVSTGTLREAGSLLPLDRIDLVCLTGVLEHLPDLRADLGALLQSIEERTKILIEVPALEESTRKPFEPYGEFSLEHIQFFTAQSLERLMNSLGFESLVRAVVRLPKGTTDSLIGLFARRSVGGRADSMDESAALPEYVRQSEIGLRRVLDSIVGTGADHFLLYGAGSHTARLLPAMEVLGQSLRVAGIIDGNPNLQGRTIAEFEIHSPRDVANWPGLPILISSFGAQEAIAESLRDRFNNPIVCLYPQ